MRRVVFLVGASGVGKTTVAEVLERRKPWTGHTYFFDSIGVPSTEEMERRFGGGDGWQRWATRHWVDELANRTEALQLLEGQTRPSFILQATERHAGLEAKVILLDCSSEVRRQRLIEFRERPDLANPRMDHWAAYLRGQADALGLPVLDTGREDPAAIASAVEQMVGAEGLSGSAL